MEMESSNPVKHGSITSSSVANPTKSEFEFETDVSTVADALQASSEGDGVTEKSVTLNFTI